MIAFTVLIISANGFLASEQNVMQSACPGWCAGTAENKGWESLCTWAACNMCPECANCDDGIMNQDETDIDCGGTCYACYPAADISGCSTRPWNQNELLEPPEGTAWRGTCLGDQYKSEVPNDMLDPITNWTQTWGLPLHIYRGFYGYNGWYSLNSWETAFVEQGGILFYSISDKDWGNFASGQNDALIDQYIGVFQQIAPANAMISFRYEPELYVDTEGGTAGSAADYRGAWQRFHNKFSDAGVTNAVWAIDYSTKYIGVADMHPLLAACWPGDEYVDWLLWNTFLFDSEEVPFIDYTRQAYELFEDLSGVPQLYEGEYFTANYKDKLWGLGAWGASTCDLPAGKTDNWCYATDAERVEFLQGASDIFNSGDFPRLRAEVYFDTWDDNTAGGSMIDSESLEDVYLQMISASRFSENDADCTDTV